MKYIGQTLAHVFLSWILSQTSMHAVSFFSASLEMLASIIGIGFTLHRPYVEKKWDSMYDKISLIV